MGRAGSVAHVPPLIKAAKVIREKTSAVQDAEFEIGKAIEDSAVSHVTQAEGAISGIAANEL